MGFLFHIGKRSDPLSLEDRLSVGTFGLDEGPGVVVPRQYPQNIAITTEY